MNQTNNLKRKFMSQTSKISAIILLAFVAGCGPKMPVSPKIRLTGPPGATVRYIETYIDVDGSATESDSTANKVTLSDEGTYEKKIDSSHSGFTYEISADGSQPITLTLLDGDSPLASETGSNGKVLRVSAGKVPGKEPMLEPLSFRVPDAAPSVPVAAEKDPSSLTDKAACRTAIEEFFATLDIPTDTSELMNSLSEESRATVDKEVLAALSAKSNQQRGKFLSLEPNDLEIEPPGQDEQRNSVRVSGTANYQRGSIPFEITLNDALQVSYFELRAEDFPAFHSSLDGNFLRVRGESYLNAFLGDDPASSLAMMTLLADALVPETPYTEAAKQVKDSIGDLTSLKHVETRNCKSPLVVLDYELETEDRVVAAAVAFGFENWRARVLDVQLQDKATGDLLFATSRWIQAYEVIAQRVFRTIETGDEKRIRTLFHTVAGELLKEAELLQALGSFSSQMGDFIGLENDGLSKTVGRGEYSAVGEFFFQNGTAKGRLVFGQHKLIGLLMESDDVSIDTFAHVEPTGALVQRGAKLVRHLFDGEAEDAYSMMGPEIHAAVNLAELEEMVDGAPAARSAVLDTARLEDQPFIAVPVSLSIFYLVRCENGEPQIAQVDFALDRPVAESPPRIVAFQLAATDRFQSTSLDLQRRSIEKLASVDADAMRNLFPPQSREGMNTVVMSAFQKGLRERWGEFRSLSPAQYQAGISYQEGDKTMMGKGTATFEKGEMPVTLGHEFEFLTEFTVDLKKSEWIHHLETEAFREQGKQMIELGFAGNAEAAYELFNNEFREQHPVETIEELFSSLGQKHGTLKRIEYQSEQLTDQSSDLTIHYLATMENTIAEVTVVYEVSAIGASIIELDFTPTEGQEN